MNKTRNEKKFDVAIVGGGLTGQLMASILVNSCIISKRRLCWINTESKLSKDKRVSFINHKNFLKLKNDHEINFLKKNYMTINTIQVHNFNERQSLNLKDKNSHGIIIRNDILKEKLSFSKNDLVIYKSKVVSTNCDQHHRHLILEDDKIIKASLVLSADGNSSSLRNLTNIEYISHALDHKIISGYLECKNFDTSTAKQIFLKDSFVGLLPYSKNLINFVWSLDNQILNKNPEFKYYDEITKRLNYFFSKDNINFNIPMSQYTNLQTYPINVKYVKIPFKKRILLIGDAAHSIHPLAGQGLNLSIEDCFNVLKCLKSAKKIGKDFGETSILHEYTNLRKTRNNFITLVTTILFYIFKKQNKYLNKFINYSFEKANKTSLKQVFKILARGY